MTVLWWILGLLALLVIIVLSLRVGVLITVRASAEVRLRIGPKTIPVYPAAEKKTKAPKKKNAAGKEDAAAKKPRPALDLTAQDVREAIAAAWQAVERVLRRVGRRVRIDPCEVSIVVGGSEPDRVAQQFGRVSAVVWTVMPRLEQLLHIRDPYIHMDVDFNAPATNVEGQLGAYLRIGDLIAIAFAAAAALLKFYFPFRRRQKARHAAAAAVGTPPAAAQ